MEVDSERLREDIEANAQFGEVDVDEGRGRTVLSGTEADRDAREYLVRRMEASGLDVRVDAVGNIAGRWVPEGVDPDAAAVAAGSHLDSVPYGGIFDGPLGVYAALEAVRSIQEADVELSRPLEVVSFTEEEGTRFDIGLLGSSVATGRRDVDAALQLEDEDGLTLGECLESIGFHGDGRLPVEEWDAWLEVHVEQGTILEEAGDTVGVVEAIAGLTNAHVHIEGEANHAGATPMPDRTDALAAASEFVLAVERSAQTVVETASPTAVGTVGKLDVRPNAKNVIAGEVALMIDVRDVEYDSIQTIMGEVRDTLDELERTRDVSTVLDWYRDQEPSKMSERCVETAIAAADEAGLSWQKMHSAALHDTAYLADVTDTVLLFAPSEDGISHNPLEWTSWEDCTAVTRALAGTMVDLAQQ